MSALIISDTHYHNFNQYAQTGPDGLNSRLKDIIRATGEAVKVARRAGVTKLIHAGDVFHVRGNISPTVLNPVLRLYETIVNSGMEVYMISGNHDLETNETVDVASTVAALRSVGVKVINEVQSVTMDDAVWSFIPWMPSIADLKTAIKAFKRNPEAKVQNLVIHAPLDDVIPGLPNHGLTPDDFKDSIFDNVFVGHYHNHKVFAVGDKKIMSVGALTHQNWGDVDSRAGYIIWTPYGMQQHETGAPKFIKVDIMDIETAKMTDDYVKVVGGTFSTPLEVADVRNELILKGAKAVVVEGLVKRPSVTRTGTIAGTAPTIHSILEDYVKRNYPTNPEVLVESLSIMREVYD